MKTMAIVLIMILTALASMPWLQRHLPSHWDPFKPLEVTDAPGPITRYKLQRLRNDPAACLAVLQRAREAGFISFTQPPAMKGACPLENPIRIQRFARVTLSSSFLASCPLAVSSTMFVIQANQIALTSPLKSPLGRIEHVGSYACRNIYHRAQGRLSEHATADAWDITAFRLTNGTRISVGRDWHRTSEASALLHRWFDSSCAWFGNALGPNYNAAHASHFHLGMRGYMLCR
ncbi:extensin family protein [Pantoea alhagi]|uniref:extensin-like domain-containing protein n=1 Tax=Pantoea alhagi TaxID=1891675 RepID=UPI00202B63F6|nr:extensin family protein [Pantoea alhagi]URQ62112.1 extensin family protein [Pantoea alhagi]